MFVCCFGVWFFFGWLVVFFFLIKSQKDLNTLDKWDEHEHAIIFSDPKLLHSHGISAISSLLHLRTVHSYYKTVYSAWCCTNTMLLVGACQHFNHMSHYAKNADNADYQTFPV